MNSVEERDRAETIAREANRFGDQEETVRAISSGETARQFRERLLLKHSLRPATLGMSRSEISRYSLRSLLSNLGSGKFSGIGGIEHDVHRELVGRYGEPSNAGTAYVPPDVFAPHVARRDLTAASATAGGFLVQTENPGFIELARPRSVLLSLGASVLEGLTANITFPRLTTGSTVTGLPTEATSATESTPVTGQVALTPKQISVYVEYSRQLLMQSNPSVERVLAQEMLSAFGAQLDFLGLRGTGAGGLPLGLLNTPGIGDVMGTSLALAGILQFQTDIVNRLGPTCGYVTTQAVAALLAARQKFTGSDRALWEGNLYNGEVGGFPAMSTMNMTTDAMIFGNFEQLLAASWGTLAIEINPYADFKAAIFGARIIHSVDFAVRDAVAFSAATSIT